VNRILYLWLYRLVAAIGHLANFMLLLIQHVIKSVYLHDVEDWDRKGAHAWSIVCLLLLYVFSNFLCCVTIVKVSSIRFLQWYPFSYALLFWLTLIFFLFLLVPGYVLNINYHTFSLLCHQFFTTITADEPAPGLKTIFSFKVPYQRSGNVSYLI
jgi:hypothetical protein